MEPVISILLYALIGLAGFLVIGFIGLKIPAPLRWPVGEPTSDMERKPLPDGLPTAVRRWLSGSQDDLPTPHSLVAWGRGSVPSRLPLVGSVWLPLSWTLYLVPGQSFIMQTRITWFRRRFIRGGEEYRDGKGTYILGTDVLEKPYLNETERTLAWLFFLWLTPGALAHLPEVQIQDQTNTPVITVQQAELPILTFSLNFDPTTGALQKITTTRKGSGSGEDYPYLVNFSQPRQWDQIGLIPTHFVGEWEHDVVIKFELAGLMVNQDVSEAMQTGVVDLA